MGVIHKHTVRIHGYTIKIHTNLIIFEGGGGAYLNDKSERNLEPLIVIFSKTCDRTEIWSVYNFSRNVVTVRFLGRPIY